MKTLVAVEGQTLRWYGKIPEIADNSVQFVQLEFSLPEDWADLVVVAQFSQTKTYNKLLENGCCYLPAELVAGPCEVSLFGQRAGENVRATSVPLRFKISRSGFTSTAETPIPPTPDLYAQLLEKLGHKDPSESVSIEDDGEGNVSFAPGFEGDGEDHELKSFATGKTVYRSFSDKTARRELRGKLTNPGGLTSGQVLKVKSVDENGDVVLEGVDMPSGGSSVTIDTTLTQPGQAADAKATGDAISKLSQQNVELDTTLTQSFKAADAKATGDEIKRVEGKIPSIEGLAKSEDIPTKPEDIGAQPVGDYLTKAPVVSVNGKDGAVVLSASDVGALPNTYTPPNQTAEQVGADPKGTAASAVSAHNTNANAHNDIRQELAAINARLTAFFNSDNQTLDELSEIVAYITSNKSLIDAITTSKVSVADIVNNLTTNVANKPLSAAQGVVLKSLIDGLSASLADYQPKGNYALESAVPTKVSQLQNDAKYLTAVTAAMITAALGYTPINPGLATLARHTDGLLYLFVDGKPVGSGVELPTGGIDGYVDADNNIVVRGLDEGVTYKFYFELADGSLVEGGELVYDNTVYYTVTSTLTNCTNSNSAVQVVGGESYEATITANSGYELESVVVTMGGVDISSTTVSSGTITIPAVTGNIVIAATATEVQTGPAYTNQIPISTDASGNPFNGGQGWKTGYRLSISGGGETASNGYECTGFIPAKQNDVISIKNIDVASESATNVVCYDASRQPYNAGSGQYGVTLYGLFVTNGSNDGGVYTATLGGGVANCFGPGLAYIRIGSKSITAESIVAINQDIV